MSKLKILKGNKENYRKRKPKNILTSENRSVIGSGHTPSNDPFGDGQL